MPENFSFVFLKKITISISFPNARRSEFFSLFNGTIIS